MEYRVLGPFQVINRPLAAGGVARTPKAAKIKTLLATLLVRANEVVSHDQLLDSIWRGQVPRSAHSALHVYVSNYASSSARTVSTSGRCRPARAGT